MKLNPVDVNDKDKRPSSLHSNWCWCTGTPSCTCGCSKMERATRRRDGGHFEGGLKEIWEQPELTVKSPTDCATTIWLLSSRPQGSSLKGDRPSFTTFETALDDAYRSIQNPDPDEEIPLPIASMTGKLITLNWCWAGTNTTNIE